MVDDRIIDRLRKLIAHQRSAERIGNLAEADAFASKVQELLERHQLEAAEVDVSDEEQESDPIRVSWFDPGSKDLPRRRTGWLERIACGVASAHFCKLLTVRGKSHMVIVGRHAEREVATFMIVYLGRAARRLCDLELKSALVRSPRLKKRAWRASFLYEFATAVAIRYLIQIRARKETHGEAALVVFERIERELEMFVGRLGSAPRDVLDRPGSFSRSGAALGRHHGEAIDLSIRPVAPGRTRLRLPPAGERYSE